MSFLRALRRGCKGTYDLNTSEFGSVLRCFDIPSRRNAVEPFVVGEMEESEQEEIVSDQEHRLYRTAIPEENENAIFHTDITFKASPPRNLESGYHNLWSASNSLNSTTTTSRTSAGQHVHALPQDLASPLLSNFPKLQVQGTTPPKGRLLHNRLQEILIQDPPERDWNAEFQAILKRPLLERGTELKKLCDDFVAAAKSLGETIIKEQNLPLQERTIQPLTGKGKAGGEKFKAGNIFFKFAVDQDGIYPSDHEAMKVAGHELKGLTALVSCGMMLGLNFPLLALIDFRGFRLIATSALPISDDTIVYGSCDGGNTVHTDLPEMNILMEKVFRILNLKGHWTGLGEQLKWIHGPCDIEGHEAKDGKLYVVDTARVWPPETPDRSTKGGFLFRLLRPELVKSNPVPLSSDAFTYFGHHDAEIHNAEVAEATQHLFDTVIPEFALSLEGRTLTGFDLVEELHRAGINCRHLGSVRESVVSAEMRSIILLEIIARTMKNKLRRDMRGSISREQNCYDEMAVEFFNLVFGHQGEHSYNFWNIQLKQEILEHFASALNDAEKEQSYTLFHRIDLITLFKRLQSLTGVTFRKGADPICAPLSLSDLVVIQVRAKHMYAIPRIEADTLAELARTKEPTEALRLYTAARDLYRSVIALKPDDTTVLQNLGMVLTDIAKLKLKLSQDVSGCDRLFEMAYDKFECSLSIKGNDHNALIRWGNALCEQAASKAALGDMLQADALYSLAGERYTKAHAIRGDDRDVMFNWGNQLRNRAKILVQRGELEEAEAQLSQAAQRYRTCMLLPRTGNDQLTLDTLINWGCGWLALARIRHALLRPLTDVANCFDQARLQFMKAAALVKRGSLFDSAPDKAKKYLDVLSYNLRCLTAVQERCLRPSDGSSSSPTTLDVDFLECDPIE